MIVDCSAFEKNADGSWRAIKDTVVKAGPGAGAASMGISKGTTIVSTQYIVNGVPLLTVLERDCASTGR
jgi:hypothetical protein